MSKCIRLNRSKLKEVIKESTYRILSEIDWRTSNAAADKSEDMDAWGDEALDSLENVAEYINWYVTNTDNAKSKVYIKYLNEIRKFIERKKYQSKNLYKMNKDNFKKQHNGMDYIDFENALPDDESLYTPSQREYADYML